MDAASKTHEQNNRTFTGPAVQETLHVGIRIATRSTQEIHGRRSGHG